MNRADSVTTWLRHLQAGERATVQKLWQRYCQRLVDVARKHLRQAPRRAADEEDIALHAFDSFCRAVEKGRYPDLADRENLWQVLVSLTIRKSTDLVRYETRQKRDSRRTYLQSELVSSDADSGMAAFANMLAEDEPDPAFAVELADQLQWLLDQLPDEHLRQITLLKLEGHTNSEIARELHCATSTIERRLRLIRSVIREASPSYSTSD